MPALEHSLGIQNPRNVERREERARQIIRRLPVEVSGAILGLRRQRIALERIFALAAEEGDVAATCRISDSLVKISDALQRLNRDSQSKKGKKGNIYEGYIGICNALDPDSSPLVES